MYTPEKMVKMEYEILFNSDYEENGHQEISLASFYPFYPLLDVHIKPIPS